MTRTPKDKTWKAAERAIAARLGGVRIPVTGRHTRDTPDLNVPVFAVEVKHRKRLPDWLHSAVKRAPCRVAFSGVPKYWQVLRVYTLSQLGAPQRAHLPLLIEDMRFMPAWLRNALEQAEGASKATGRAPLVVLHEKGMRYEDCICLQWAAGVVAT